MATRTEETEIALLKQEMTMVKEQNDKDHKAIMSEVGEIKLELKTFIASADKKYASKSAERMVYAIYGALAIGFLGLVSYLLEQHFK